MDFIWFSLILDVIVLSLLARFGGFPAFLGGLFGSILYHTYLFLK